MAPTQQDTEGIPPPAAPSSSRYQNLKVNAAYLAMGSKAAVSPTSLTTRSVLTTTRYVARYVIRRLIRYAKYALVGGIIAAVGGTLLGTLGSGLAFFAAPGILGGMGIGAATAMVKFGWRHRGNHFRSGVFSDMKERAAAGRDGAKDEGLDAKEIERQESRKKREDVWMRV